jgi:hypothetical protein
MARTLRYELESVSPSEIADQLYCEYKVHLSHLHPEVEVGLAAQELGEAGHSGLMSVAKPISRPEIDKAVEEGRHLAVCEWTLEGVYQGVKLRGEPDYFEFEGKQGLLLLDFKFTRSQRLFRGQEFQAEVYSILAGLAGFSTDELFCGVVRFPHQLTGANRDEVVRAKAEMLRKFQADGTLFKVQDRCAREREEMLARGFSKRVAEDAGWEVHLARFDRPRAEAALDDALGFWLKEREPVPESRIRNKCRACAYNAAGLCRYALAEADPTFRVRREPDGKVLVSR